MSIIVDNISTQFNNIFLLYFSHGIRTLVRNFKGKKLSQTDRSLCVIPATVGADLHHLSFCGCYAKANTILRLKKVKQPNSIQNHRKISLHVLSCTVEGETFRQDLGHTSGA